MQKSISKSGIDTRSGFKKRSNNNPYLQRIKISHRQRISNQRARARPPDPDPTGMS